MANITLHIRTVDEEQHWITVHPNGGTGHPILIGGSAGNFHVEGGAGGSMTGEAVHPHSMSGEVKANPGAGEDLEKYMNEKANQEEKPKSESENDLEKYMRELAGESENDLEKYMRELAGEKGPQPPTGGEKGPQPPTGGDLTEEQQLAKLKADYGIAAGTAERATRATEGLDKTDVKGNIAAHEKAAKAHEEAFGVALNKEEEDFHYALMETHLRFAKAYRESEKYDILAKAAKDLANDPNATAVVKHAAYVNASDQAWKAYRAQGDVGNREEADRLYNERKKQLSKVDAMRKEVYLELFNKRQKEFYESPEGRSHAAISAKHEAADIETIRSSFERDYGIGFQNGPDEKALHAYREGQEEFAAMKDSMSPEQREAARNKLSKMYKDAMGLPYKVKSFTPININDGTESAKNMRRALGHIDSTFAYMNSKGYDIKKLMAKHRVSIATGDVGKYGGLSWQGHGGEGYLSVSPGKFENYDTFLGYRAGMKSNVDNGIPKWTSADHPEMTHAEWNQSVVIHELAHAIGLQSHRNSPDRLQAILAKMHPKVKDRIAWVEKNISQYGKTNKKETDAELASAVLSPRYVRGTFPKELEDHVDWLFGKESAGESETPPAARSKVSPSGSEVPKAKQKRPAGKELHDAAEQIAAMSEEQRDNTEYGKLPGGYAANNLYEAQKLAPKPSDKLKRLNSNNSNTLHDEWEYVANVDGHHYGVTRYDDPDANEDNEDENGNIKDYVYAFHRIDNGSNDMPIETLTADKNELFKLMREHTANNPQE